MSSIDKEDEVDEEYLDAYAYPSEGYGYEAVGAPPPPVESGTSELFAKLAILGLTVAGVATAYAILSKMSKSEKKTRRQASRSAMKILSKAAEKQSARAVNAASDRLGEFLTARRLNEGRPLRVKTEILNQT